MDQRTGCTEQRGGKEWETEGSNGNLGCEVGTSFDVCGAHNFDPLDCSVRKLGRPLLCKWSRPFETVDTRFNQELSPGTRNHIHSITHDRSRYHDDLNTSGSIFEHCAIVCIDMLSCEIPLRRLGIMWYKVNGCCAAQFISFSWVFKAPSEPISANTLSQRMDPREVNGSIRTKLGRAWSSWRAHASV
jgi:hypothetical protein